MKRFCVVCKKFTECKTTRSKDRQIKKGYQCTKCGSKIEIWVNVTRPGTTKLVTIKL
jgi:ssDNA-binding Zn-finger/Zn-ribbon topoisomerase 1